MAHRRGGSKFSQLWQLPLLLVSLGLFGYAAYLFIDPQPGMTIEEKVDIARKYIAQDRPDAAIGQLNKLLTREKLEPEEQGKIHLMLAEALDMGQKQLRAPVRINYINIIEQSRQAMNKGVKFDSVAHRRLGEAFESVGKPNDALDNYRRAMNLDPSKSLRLKRKVIDLQLAQDDVVPAELTLDDYLASPGLSDAEKSWGLCEKAKLLIDRDMFLDARLLLGDALKLASEPVAIGRVNYHLGYCAYKLRDPNEAERYLRVARDQLKVSHPLDAEAAYCLGKIYDDRDDAVTATSFFDAIITSHMDAKVAPLARLGRGVCRISLKQDDAGLTDLHDLANEVLARKSFERNRDEVVKGLQRASQMMSGRGNFQGALEALVYEQQLEPDPSAGFYSRLGGVFEQRADQIEQTISIASPADKVRRAQQVRDMRLRAGDAQVAYSRKLVVSDDKGYADALWKGVDLYEKSGSVQSVISSLELFVTERPEDSLAPEALLRLGRAYQTAGLFDKAIAAYQRNQFRYPQALAATKSAVPLAQAYIAKGPEAYGKAEAVLLSVVSNNPILTPEAEEFRQALFELAQLYYRTTRFEESVSRLEEFTQRYPQDERIGQLLFLMGDSYRKSAGVLDGKMYAASATASAADGAGGIDLVEAQAARKIRLGKARGLYDRVIELFKAKAPTREIDQLYVKLSYFYRADCLYDLGEYADAIKLYDSAAFRYQDDPSALAAYVQIVNAYCALGKVDEAKTANERAKWLLRRIPPESFNDGSFSMPKAYWEQWLKWTSDSGMW